MVDIVEGNPGRVVVWSRKTEEDGEHTKKKKNKKKKNRKKGVEESGVIASVQTH